MSTAENDNFACYELKQLALTENLQSCEASIKFVSNSFLFL